MKKHTWPRSALLARRVVPLLLAGAVAGAAAVACMTTGPDADPRLNGCISAQCFDGSPPGEDAGGFDSSVPPAPDGGYPNPLQGVTPTAKLIKGGFQFTEGPVWIGGKLLFSDVQGNTIHELLSDGGTVPFRNGSNGANGNAVDNMGRLVTCEGAARRVVRTNASLMNPQPIATTHMGPPFNEPNDVIVRADGNIYFTDPRYGNDPDGGQDKLAVYRLAPGAAPGAATRLAFDFQKPNGIALSPDGKILYVVDNGDGRLLSADLNADGSLNGGFSKVADADGGDGMAVDFAGNLYVTASAGVLVFDKTGAALGTITIPMGTPANCTFGGSDMKTLYITSNNGGGNPNTGIYSIKLNVPGLP